jgi:hypothetical protein
VDISLLGIVEKSVKLKSGKQSIKPDLLYAVTTHNDGGKIRNLHHLGGTILSNSRKLFLGTILKLLRLLDSRKMEICYIDTDSVFLGISEPNLYNILKPEYNNATGKMELDKLFESKTSQLGSKHQSGLLKSEGLFQRAVIRNSKSYSLSNVTEDNPNEVIDKLNRCKGIRHRERDKLNIDHFAPDAAAKVFSIRSDVIRSRKDYAIELAHESKVLCHMINLKRFCCSPIHSMTL